MTVLKGTGFSPYMSPINAKWALAPEGMPASLRTLVHRFSKWRDLGRRH